MNLQDLELMPETTLQASPRRAEDAVYDAVVLAGD